MRRATEEMLSAVENAVAERREAAESDVLGEADADARGQLEWPPPWIPTAAIRGGARL